MTREEKINFLKAIIQECEEYEWWRKDALFEIIKDLEQQPHEDCNSKPCEGCDSKQAMELVIKIPVTTYNHLRNGGNIGASLLIENAIKEGTPLPKGHKRLIAEPTEAEIEGTIGGQNDFADCIRDSVENVFANAKTIIEADAENIPAKEDEHNTTEKER